MRTPDTESEISAEDPPVLRSGAVPDCVFHDTAKRPEDHSLDSLFHHAGGDTDFYFDSDGELLEWFREYGSVNAGTVQELRACMDEKYVCLYEFENPYQ